MTICPEDIWVVNTPRAGESGSESLLIEAANAREALERVSRFKHLASDKRYHVIRLDQIINAVRPLLLADSDYSRKLTTEDIDL